MHNKENIPQNLFQNPFISNVIKVNKKRCQKHDIILGTMFCVDCLSYALCSKCIDDHLGHELIKFEDEEQLKSQTRQILLETLEDTLKTLKSKENEMKNKTSELKLIKQSLKKIQKEIVESLSTMFKEIEEEIGSFLKLQQQKYQKEVDKFYDDYNSTNDSLRQNLMLIIDGQIDFETFNRSMVIKEAPVLPSIHKYKLNYDKVKKTYKQLKKCIEQIQEKLKNNEKMGNCKLTKYIENKNHGGYDKVNESFMGMLRLMDNKENVPALNINKLIK